mgnify:CR=1 FL=1|jgi:hypothetical protein
MGQKRRFPENTNFKLGGGSNGIDIPGVPVYRKPLDEGILGEANNDGTIFISDEIEPGSPLEKEVLAHEMKHMTDMALGKIDYGDNWVEYNGKRFERKDGKIKYNGKWYPEGDKRLPWEQH